MPRSRRVCSYCQQEMGEDEFKCKACGNLVAMKTVPAGTTLMEENEEALLDRYSIGLLILVAILDSSSSDSDCHWRGNVI